MLAGFRPHLTPDQFEEEVFVFLKGEEVLIPFARAICPVVDISARRILITPPDGLLDLNRERSLRERTIERSGETPRL